MSRIKMRKVEAITLAFESYRRFYRTKLGRSSCFIEGSYQKGKMWSLLRDNELDVVEGALEEFVFNEDRWLSEREFPINYFLKYADKYIRSYHGKAHERERRAEAEIEKAQRSRRDREKFEAMLGCEWVGPGGGAKDLR